MIIEKIDTYKDVYAPLDELENRSLMLKAFGVMLECSMRSGEDLEPISDGTYILLENQFKMLNFIGETLRDQYNALKASKLEVSNIDTIAAACGVTPQVALNVVSFATGIPYSRFQSSGVQA